MAQQKKATTKRTETVASPAGEARKQARVAKNEQLHREKQRFGGLGANERRFLEKEGFNLELEFSMDVSDAERRLTAKALREDIVAIKKRKKQAELMKKFMADQLNKLNPIVDSFKKDDLVATEANQAFKELELEYQYHAQRCSELDEDPLVNPPEMYETMREAALDGLDEFTPKLGESDGRIPLSAFFDMIDRSAQEDSRRGI